MTLYHVHVYREMRLYYPGIDAATPEKAAHIAAGKLADEAETVEDCDGENLTTLVDVTGDDEFTQSVTIDFEPERLRKSAQELLEALKQIALALTHHRHWLPSMVDHLRKVAGAAIAKATVCQPVWTPAVTADATGSLPPDPEGMNDSRAEWATYALEAFMSQTGSDRDSAVTDLLCDLLHLADRSGSDFSADLERARMHYACETQPEPNENSTTIPTTKGE